MKIRILLFTLLAFFVSTLSAQSGEMDNEAAKLYNEGNSQMKSGNYAGALESYAGALKISKDYRIYYQLSSVYKKQRKYEDAEQALLECLKLKPDFSTAYNSLGTTYYSWGKFDKAVENFTKFKESADDKKLQERAAKYIGLAYAKLGEEALKDKNYQDAEKHLLNAVENYSYDAAYLKLADVYVETGRYEEALKAADNAINYRDKKSSVPKGAPYFYKGMAFKGLNDKEKAKENFKISSSDKQYRDRSNHEIKYLN
ncbi:MAG: tetratricopeptide repeat protein [Ignavibacteriales bacterium]|nr:tetratricopeptide repeat protein [Ignavibacteriales bacterium]MCB9259360.1 tetratricopeptide repeat protein [Ignavibacteriales bacterium]